jgi:hypothetical protein
MAPITYPSPNEVLYFSSKTSYIASSLKEDTRLILDQMPEFLRWQGDAGMFAYMPKLLAMWTDARLRLWKLDDEGGLIARILDLPNANRERLLRSPKVFAMLRAHRMPMEQDWDLLEGFLKVELYLLGERKGPVVERWSALADVYISAEGAVWLPRARELVLDAYSPNLRDGWLAGTATTCSREELLAMQPRIERGLDIIQAACPLARAAIGSSVKTVVLLKDEREPNVWQSMSTERWIGSIMLRNVCYPGVWSDALIVEGLVHEAIHSMLYPIELLQSLYTDLAASYSLRVTSSWSGRSLPLHSFTHACFVWFGLWNFWETAATAGFDCPERLEAARAGFRGVRLQDIVPRESQEALQPFVWTLLQRIFAIAREAIL